MSFSGNPRCLQLIFATVLLLCATAGAQHRIVLRDGSAREGEIVGASATTVSLKVQQGTVGIPKAQVASIQMPEPEGYKEALAAWEAGDAGKALGALRSVVNTYKGLPTDWAQQATGLLGDIYVSAGDMASAEKAYQEFQQLYPGSGSAGAEVGMARLAFSKKEYAAAKQKLEPITHEALEKKSVSKLEGVIYGQAFLLLGEIKETEGNLQGALEDYLRTVTLFYHDARSAQVAEQKADAIRKQATVRVP